MGKKAGKKGETEEKAPAADSGPGPWECPECAQENEATDDVCCACDAPRPAAAGGNGGDAGGGLENFKVGLVVSCGNMEGKDKLKKISVDVGAAEPVTVVTNAPNVSEGSLIVVALVGATVKDGGEEIQIKKMPVGGVVSCGMVCSMPMLGWKGGNAKSAALLPSSFKPGDKPPATKPPREEGDAE